MHQEDVGNDRLKASPKAGLQGKLGKQPSLRHQVPSESKSSGENTHTESMQSCLQADYGFFVLLQTAFHSS